MGVSDGTYDIGPQTGQLILHTGREGAARRVGHDLTITFGTWSGHVTVSGSAAKVDATVELHSIEIVEGTGGVLSLTDRDRREIRSTALRLMDADHHPQASFVSRSVTVGGDDATMEGDLTIRGRRAPVSFAVTGGDGWHASTTVKQSQFGITPYRAFLGALRLADDVRVDVDVTLPSRH